MSDIDVNAIADTLNSKVDLADGANQASVDYVVESQYPTAENNYTWYRLYKSGWVEQGGKCSGATSYTVTFPKEFADTNYTPMVSFNYSHNGNIMNMGCTNLTTSTMLIAINDGNQGSNRPVFWRAEGMSAQGGNQ